MEHVAAFIDDSLANSENFRATPDADNDSGADICVSGFYHFKLALDGGAFAFARGEGCSASSAAINKILAQANGGRKKNADGAGDAQAAIHEALVALREAYLKYADDLDEEAADEDGDDGGPCSQHGADDDDDPNAEFERQEEIHREEIARRRAEADAKLTPEERERKARVEAYVAQLKGAGNAGDLSTGAVARVLQDLQRIKMGETPERGWTCEPNAGSLKEWIIKLTAFEKGSKFDADMDQWSKATGKPKVVVLSVKMHANYPYKPPFVRVIRPKFVFRTGHVTLGGSVCMETLVDQGWSPLLEFESIVESVRATILDDKSGARVDHAQHGDYQEHEAREAFNRLVATHGWKHQM